MNGVWKQGTKANEQGVLWVQPNPRVVHVRCEVRLSVALCCLRMGCCLLRNRVAIRWALLHTCARDTCPPGREASYWVRVRSTNAQLGWASFGIPPGGDASTPVVLLCVANDRVFVMLPTVFHW